MDNKSESNKKILMTVRNRKVELYVISKVRGKNMLGAGLSTIRYSILEQLFDEKRFKTRERDCRFSVTKPLSYFDCDNIHFLICITHS